MIVSNLKLTYTTFGFFIVYCTKLEDKIQLKDVLILIGTILGISLLIVYPIATMFFLISNQERLDQPVFKNKFSTIYDGIYTNKKL